MMSFRAVAFGPCRLKYCMFHYTLSNDAVVLISTARTVRISLYEVADHVVPPFLVNMDRMCL